MRGSATWQTLDHVARRMTPFLITVGLVILDVEDFPIMRHWYLVHLKDKRLPPMAESFKEYVLEEGRDVIPGMLGTSAK